MAQDPVAVPVLQVGQQHVVALGIADPGVHAEECLWVRSQVEALGKVVRLVLRMASYQCGVLLALMEVERQPAVVVEYLRQPAETGVCRRVLGAHDGDGIGLDRLEQAEALAAFQHEVAQALAGHVDLVVRLGRRGKPALADEAAFPHVIGAVRELEPTTRWQELARHPGRFEPEDAVLLCERLIQYSVRGFDCHDLDTPWCACLVITTMFPGGPWWKATHWRSRRCRRRWPRRS